MTNAERELTEMRRLLQLEYEEEKASFEALTDKVGLKRLVDRGRAWMPLRFGRTFYNSLNQKVVEIYRPEELAEEEHEFEYGKPVRFFNEDPQSGKILRRFSGTVSLVDGNRMLVAVSDGADISRIEWTEGAGVMLSFDETTYRTMFEAIDRTLKAKGRLGELRDLIFSRRPAEELTFEPLGFSYLNPAQEEAVNKVLRAKDVAVVHGPPGTGKTTTLVEAVNETLMRETQVLVCAQSNMAVDWISEKLSERGISVLRIGNPSRVTDSMLANTYEHRFADHPDYPTLWQIRRTLRDLHGQRKGKTDQWHQKVERLKARAVELELRIKADLFGEARVIACTLTGSASRVLDGMKFSTLFVDEAAQALEAATLIPLRKVGRIILAGDHCQLPPTVKSYEAMKQGLGKSLMERIVELHPESVTLLTTQYRMSEALMKFPNEWFYGGHIQAAPSVRWSSILDFDAPVEWIDTSAVGTRHGASAEGTSPDTHVGTRHGASADEEDLESLFRESVDGVGFGRVNKAEADLALEALEAYIMRIGGGRLLAEKIDIGLISPYRAQVRYLRKQLSRRKFFKQYRHLISINTVDGFQGQERDVIMISMVRSNERGDIGFLRDLRRMNVAITRARRKLIIIGDAPTLTRHPFYRKLYESI